VLFNIALFFFLAEVVLRIGGYYQNYGEANGGNFIDYFRSTYPGPLATWTPNKTHIHTTNEFSYEVASNSLGIRDVEHTLEKPQGVKRIVVLGDSFTEGVGAPFDSAWHQRMAYYLNQDSTLGEWEIINGAASGGDPFYGYEMLRRVGLQYEPDLVIQVFNSTDVHDYMARGGMERFVNDSHTVWRQPNMALHLAYKYSHVVRFVVEELLKYNDFYQSPKEQLQLEHASVSAYHDLFLQMDSLTSANGAKLVVAFQPMNYEVYDKHYYYATDSIHNLVNREGIASMKVMDSLPQHMLDYHDQYYWPIDAHMNSFGYDAWGHGMYRYLKAEGFAQPEPAPDTTTAQIP
jgi:lysophospholipase L1-like esterase